MTPTMARLKREKVIPLKAVMSLPVFIARPTYRQVKRWRKYGISGRLLETFRQGRYCFTTVEAVERFLVSTQFHKR